MSTNSGAQNMSINKYFKTWCKEIHKYIYCIYIFKVTNIREYICIKQYNNINKYNNNIKFIMPGGEDSMSTNSGAQNMSIQQLLNN